ncbi:guanylate kinase [Legionella sp. CNM-4043-24]|uniref:guanylate kinase n=1 Tax=Legionella sp. CNM-4043-24 TaxID=3421646 RepID=UPI00403A8263
MTGIVNGTLYIVAAPSGGGKTSLIRELLSSVEGIEVSVSHTTRSPRPGEQDGEDYFFVDEATFVDMISQNAFIEHAQVFGQYYGTSIAQIKNRLAAGIDVVLDIDWQGAQQIRHLFSDATSIFILPPDRQVLRQRLQNRGQDDEAVINARMQQARDEMSHYAEFDYLLVNDDFSRAALELQSIVVANRLKTERQSAKIGKLLSLLLT